MNNYVNKDMKRKIRKIYEKYIYKLQAEKSQYYIIITLRKTNILMFSIWCEEVIELSSQ